jgi:hypothetical protein
MEHSSICKMIPAFKSTQEHDVECHQLIQDNENWCEECTGVILDRKACLFEDILGLNLPRLYQSTDAYGFKKQRILSTWLQQSQECITHGDLCALPSSPDYGLSGLPCEDMSRAGLAQKRHGPTAPVYMSHAKFCNQQHVKLATIECTPDTCFE